jgi:hypothetical protein
MRLPWRISIAAALCVLVCAVFPVTHAAATLGWHRGVVDAFAPLGRWTVLSLEISPSSAANGRVIHLVALLQGSSPTEGPVAQVEVSVSVGGALLGPALFGTVLLSWPGGLRRRLLSAAIGLALLPIVEGITVSSQLLAPLVSARWVLVTGEFGTNPWDRWLWFMQAGGWAALAVLSGLVVVEVSRQIDAAMRRFWQPQRVIPRPSAHGAPMS